MWWYVILILCKLMKKSGRSMDRKYTSHFGMVMANVLDP